MFSIGAHRRLDHFALFFRILLDPDMELRDAIERVSDGLVVIGFLQQARGAVGLVSRGRRMTPHRLRRHIAS